MAESFYIIGVGKTGSAFSTELENVGYKINFITERNPETLDYFSEKLKVISSSGKIEKEFIEGTDAVLICVQDRYIKDVIKEISGLNIKLSKKYFIHVSGAESTNLFSQKSFNPDNIATMHPIQTFNKISLTDNGLLRNIYFGIEGTEKGKELPKRIVESLNSNYIEIPKDKKYLYHSACVVSSNFLITLLNISSELLGNMGIEKKETYNIFKPIIENTLKNISEDGLVNSLTGPFERNDVETISNHLHSINKELPSLIPFYTLLGMETVKVAFKKESLNLKNVINLLDLMNEYIKTESEIYKKTIN